MCRLCALVIALLLIPPAINNCSWDTVRNALQDITWNIVTAVALFVPPRLQVADNAPAVALFVPMVAAHNAPPATVTKMMEAITEHL